MSHPILFLHGQPGSARDWDGVISALPDGVKAIAHDRPGWDSRTSPANVAGNAEAALASLDRLGIERAIVVGHSFGGTIAAWIAAAHPQRVRALVLAAPAANAASLVWLDRVLALPGGGYAAAAGLLSTVGAALKSASVRRRAARAFRLDEQYLDATGRRLREPTTWRSFYAEQRSLIRDLPALEARLGSISAPTTIVAGSADRIVPVASARLLSRQIPHSKLVLISRVGHLLMLRRAERLAELILAAA